MTTFSYSSLNFLLVYNFVVNEGNSATEALSSPPSALPHTQQYGMAKHRKQLLWNAISRAKILSNIGKLQRSSLAREAPWVSQSTHPRKFGNHVTVHRPPTADRRPPTADRRPLTDRPSAPHAYQCKITQSTGVATQTQVEIILVGNRIATRVL